MAQYYTLDEVAKILNVAPDKVREMVRLGKIRGFPDGRTMRFKAKDVEELAREMGLGSDPELPLGETPPQKQGNSSSGSSKRKQAAREEEEQPKKPAPGGGRKPTMVKPPVGSDSDVRLVVEDFSLEEEEPAPASRSGKKSDQKQARPDSGLKLLPMDEDSDVKLVPDEEPAAPVSGTSRRNTGSKTPSDSDIRIDVDSGSDSGYEPLVTEEIDLDAEEKSSPAPRKKSELKKPSSPEKSGSKLPTSSPFELSDDDIVLAPEDDEPAPPSSKKSSGKSSSKSGSNKKADIINMSLEDEGSEDDIDLGLESVDDPNNSGINLQDPADSGPSLEDGSSDMELALSPLDSGSSSSGSRKKSDEGSSSEFELTLDEDEAAEEQDSSSEFELTLEEDAADSDLESSDSEFELTLDGDDEGVSLSTEDDEGDEKDIFETNLDVPALDDDESASEAVPLEATDEIDEDASSEFELDLDAEDGEGDEETGSQVVPLDEDEADEGDDTVAKTVNRRGGKPKGRALADFGSEDEEEETQDDDYEQETDYDEDEDERPAAAGAGGAVSVPWGPLPALMLVPTVIVLFVVGLMSFELVRGMWGYQKSTAISQMVIKPIAKMFDEKLPD